MAGGKIYQITQVDPTDPHTKGMVYQVTVVGGQGFTLASLSDTDITEPEDGNFLMFNGTKWVNVESSASASFSTLLGSPYDNENLTAALNADIDCGTLS